jgi:TPR repeat protein
MGGFGVYEDMEKAYAHIQNASHAGHWKAPYTLGVMHAEGTGVERNCSQAVQFLTVRLCSSSFPLILFIFFTNV